MDFDALLKEASRYESRLRAHRRALHHIPELGYEEHETHAYLMEHLRALAPDDLKTFARTGIRAVFRGDGTGRVIAFRSDIDALPIQEATGRDYASCHSGKMHACGHDGHMARLPSGSASIGRSFTTTWCCSFSPQRRRRAARET